MFEQSKSGGYTFKDEDLPLVERLKHVDSRLIPFTQMLVWVNDIHRNGLPLQED